jgi:hypothetical protein
MLALQIALQTFFDIFWYLKISKLSKMLIFFTFRKKQEFAGANHERGAKMHFG